MNVPAAVVAVWLLATFVLRVDSFKFASLPFLRHPGRLTRPHHLQGPQSFIRWSGVVSNMQRAQTLRQSFTLGCAGQKSLQTESTAQQGCTGAAITSQDIGDDISTHRTDYEGKSVHSTSGASVMKRRVQVKLPNCEGESLEDLTDLILEACPNVLSVSAELVTERAIDKEDSRCNNMDVDTWEELVQGTGLWTAALLRMTVEPAFQAADLQALLREHHPALEFEVYEPPIEKGDPGDGAEEWMLRVQQGWPPQRIGQLTVYFPWHTRPTPPVEPLEVAASTSENKGVELVLEGGAAFGSGDHATTRLCVNWLSRQRCSRAGSENRALGAQGQPEYAQHNITTGGEEWSLLDYGCGSAILALAGLRFGATSAAGVDVDGDALRSAQRNCALNGLKVDLFHAGPAVEEPSGAAASGEEWAAPADTALHGRQFDATVANILAPVLIQLAPKLAAYTKAGGSIALSGVLAFQADAVMTAYKPFFDDVRVEDEEDGWVLITGVRMRSVQQ